MCTCTCTAEIEKKYIFHFLKKHLLIIKSGGLIDFSHNIAVFVLVFPVPFYYSIILIASLAFFSCKHCTLPTILEIGKFNNQLLHLPLYQFAEHVLWETLLPRGGGGGGLTKNPFCGGWTVLILTASQQESSYIPILPDYVC